MWRRKTFYRLMRTMKLTASKCSRDRFAVTTASNDTSGVAGPPRYAPWEYTETERDQITGRGAARGRRSDTHPRRVIYGRNFSGCPWRNIQFHITATGPILNSTSLKLGRQAGRTRMFLN
ncbi:hypothetical protein EVAR_21043_1 [Eumeta japonica]|uniref:Uncharacterized protein n=1 Tax=Eumeta variegata TaxID=151549 RepID=A0A4C1V0I8_EUMVA|nr:hypothetical protein EVAR_21043_1 [Eumeta japonica]